jgi:hypothetical protein
MSNERRSLPSFQPQMIAWADHLELLRQNSLLSESKFISFVKDRGVTVHGISTGDPGILLEKGWLTSDGVDGEGRPLFHPFRIYPLRQVLLLYRQQFTLTQPSDPGNLSRFVEQMVESLPTPEQIDKRSKSVNRVADLAILVEPVYWPRIVGRLSMSGFLAENKFRAHLDEYRAMVRTLVADLDPDEWKNAHESLRIESALMDSNDSLYLLLRLSSWRRREKLKGPVAGALWLRHIAETLRRAFEDVHEQRWPEEDGAFGWWHPGARAHWYGSERLFDHTLESRRNIAWEYGLLTGSAVRWYVEGDTEYFAVLEALPDASKIGIELENLHGAIGTGKRNAPLGLRDWLAEDRRQKRFSMISVDRDVKASVKVIRRQIESGNLVGMVFAHEPDFEFANFAIEELVEVAARIDEKHGESGKAVRTADWSGVRSGCEFEERYRDVSARTPRSLKGEEWGRALCVYADEYPKRADDETERPFWRAVGIALRSRAVHYDHDRERFRLDPETFERVEIPGDETTSN